MKKILLICVVIVLSGCASFTETIVAERKTVSTGFIGCPAHEIEISDGTDHTWTAVCKGRVFYCTVAPSASCKEAITGKT
jgi:uncharacterized protein YceK